MRLCTRWRRCWWGACWWQFGKGYGRATDVREGRIYCRVELLALFLLRDTFQRVPEYLKTRRAVAVWVHVCRDVSGGAYFLEAAGMGMFQHFL